MIIETPTLSQLPAMRALWQEAFEDEDNFLDAFFSTAFSCERCRLVRKDGQVAAALYWFRCLYEKRPVAYLYAIATAQRYQKQGIFHALMEHTQQYLETLGYSGTLLVPASAELSLLYKSMGYETCSYFKELSVFPAFGTACHFSQNTVIPERISTDEYAALRRRYLPAGSIIQENENLDFLATQTNLYKGNGFLLAAHREGCHLYGDELLGTSSASLASRITHAFGCTSGTFRLPGTPDDFPLAMYRPIKKGGPAPTYFGFAFD